MPTNERKKMVKDEEILKIKQMIFEGGRQALSANISARVKFHLSEWATINRISETKFLEIAIMRLVEDCKKTPKPEVPAV